VDANDIIRSRGEMETILREESLGYLALSVEGEPYIVPLNYAYIDGTIVLHCGFEGKKIDYLRANPRVCFAVGRQTGEVQEHAAETSCHVDNDSVICYGTARTVDNLGERARTLNAFNRTFRAEADGISPARVKNCNVVEIKIAEMTGRRERDRTSTRWCWEFEG